MEAVVVSQLENKAAAKNAKSFAVCHKLVSYHSTYYALTFDTITSASDQL